MSEIIEAVETALAHKEKRVAYVHAKLVIETLVELGYKVTKEEKPIDFSIY